MRKELWTRIRRPGLKSRLMALLLVIVLPLTGMMLGMLRMVWEYSHSYQRLMANMQVVNEYNMKFKEDMEYSMYRVMIGLIDTDQFAEGDIIEGQTEYANIVKNPFMMIERARKDFRDSIVREPGSFCDIKIRGILSCLDSLETAVEKMIGNSKRSGTYNENSLIWENDVMGLCTMIQNYITQYIYYEMINMEALQKELAENTTQMVEGFLFLLLLILPAGFAISTMITRSVTKPIEALRETAERFGRGELKARAETGNLEELNVLVRSFNRLSDELIDLTEKIKQEQKNLREAEIRLLQEQINPHFLYNTLDSIVWMAESGNNAQVVEMTADLSDFFRTVLSGGQDFITVEEEEKHIRSYLKIQKIRYEDVMSYSIDMDPGIRGRTVLKMLLQPIVENALYHGIKNKRGGGKLTVRGYAEQGRLVFEVEDDGIGMEPETLAGLRRRLAEEGDGFREPQKPQEAPAPSGSRQGGFGLSNVLRRLRMYYGADAELLIESEKDVGTLVKIFIRSL